MAYGARLESVLGESPRGFESPILRQISSTACWVTHSPICGVRIPHSPPDPLYSVLGDAQPYLRGSNPPFSAR